MVEADVAVFVFGVMGLISTGWYYMFRQHKATVNGMLKSCRELENMKIAEIKEAIRTEIALNREQQKEIQTTLKVITEKLVAIETDLKWLKENSK